MDDSRTRILAERQHALHGRLCVTKELKRNILIVLRSLWVGQYLRNLLIVCTTKHELTIVKSLLCQQGKCFLAHLQNLFTFKLTNADTLFRYEAILSVIFAQLEHWCILELCHNVLFSCLPFVVRADRFCSICL